MADKLIIFDTTLRDGEQSPGASMTKDEKLRIARQLERLKVDVIEAGFAASSNGDFEAIQTIAATIKDSTVCSLARANDKDIQRAADALKPAERFRIHTFIATSPLHMEKEAAHDTGSGVRTSEAGGAFRAQIYRRRRIFSRRRQPFGHGLPVPILEAVIAEGATTINIADTVGYAVPELFGTMVKTLRERIPNSHKAVFSVHCHNDLGMAVANSLAGVQIGGARQVECTINGLGERAGNTALEEIVMATRTRKDYFNLELGIDTTQIVPASKLVSQITGLSCSLTKPWSAPTRLPTRPASTRMACSRHADTYEIMRAEDVAGRPTDRPGQAVGAQCVQAAFGRTGREAAERRPT